MGNDFIERMMKFEPFIYGDMIEMMDYKIKNSNIDMWEDVTFLACDFESVDVCLIMLIVNWDTKDAFVDLWNQEDDEDVIIDYRDGRSMVFELDTMVDMSKFEEYYYEEIRPIVKEMGKTFVLEDGKGKIVGTKEKSRLGFVDDILTKIAKAPRHHKKIFFTIDEIFESDGDLLEYLSLNGIEFMEVDLTNDMVVVDIRDVLQKDAVLLMEFNDIVEELTEKQEYLARDGI